MFGDPSTVLIPVALPTGGTVALSVILHALPTGGQSEYKHWHGNEKAAETKSTNTSSMLLKVNIHKKYARTSEQKIMRQCTSLNGFSPSLLGPQQKGGLLGGSFHCQHWLLLAKQTGHSVLSSRQLFSGWLEISINQSSFYRSHLPWLCPRSLTQGEIFFSMAWQPQLFN